MSDFDEEAERERLRDKYEQDQQNREATERMSELLLQGATMTNAHCGECGDPIFRYDGQEFCPTCEKVVADEAETGAADAGSDDTAADEVEADAGDAEAGDATPAGADGDSGTGVDPEAVGTPGRTENGVPVEGRESGADEPEDLPERREPAQVPDRDRRPRAAPRRPDPPVRREDPDDRGRADPARESGGDLADARESLQRSLLRFAREAEHAEDPRRAREHLEAASEAADALATLSEIR